jgi:hypothetical protein
MTPAAQIRTTIPPKKRDQNIQNLGEESGLKGSTGHAFPNKTSSIAIAPKKALTSPLFVPTHLNIDPYNKGVV